MAGEVARKQDIVVSPGEYLYTQNGTKGTITLHEGPTVVTLSAQDMGVVYNSKTGGFEECTRLEDAKRKCPVVVEGYYCVLLNPAKNRKQPEGSGSQQTTELDIGRKVNIPGPVMFALWPGQSAEVIRGHQLRYNQYLIARVYNEEEAKKNWSKAVVKPASPIAPPAENATAEEKAAYAAAVKAAEADAKVATAPAPKDLSVGKLLIIRGTEVSFYIPPTGISVVAEGLDENSKTQYVREALTLERLEYAILLDENGNKRYVNGPTVVFPAPTERFMEGPSADGRPSRKFRAIELNERQGLHLKVIADFKDEKGVEHKAGEQLFITGKDSTIFYPREELGSYSYDGKVQHFATIIPAGEGRYVQDIRTGNTTTLKGPAMALPDPRNECFVRRPLSDQECEDIYPGDADMLGYHRELRDMAKRIPTTRGAPSEGDVARNYKGKKGGPDQGAVIGTSNMLGGQGLYASSNQVLSSQAMSYLVTGGPAIEPVGNAMIADKSFASRDQKYMGEEFIQPSSLAHPRTLTLNTKYQNVPTVTIRTGYAVLVVSKSSDKRRVVQGPNVVLLDYDETLEAMELSTGKPKTTDSRLRTVYLRTDNNQVTDIVQVETSDYVQFNLRLGYRVSFEGDSSKWWAVENYVKFLCDRMRSDLKGAIKKLSFTQFRPNATEILQGIVLGKDKGRAFPENNMRVTDVEVLAVDCLDQTIEGAFKQSALAVVKTNIELDQLKRGLEVTKEKQDVIKEEAEVRAATEMRKNELAVQVAASELNVLLSKLSNDLKSIETKKDLSATVEELKNYEFDQDLARRKRAEEQILALKAKAQEMAITAAVAEAENVAKRFVAAKDGLSELAKAAMDTGAAVEIAKAMNIQRAIGGDSFADAASKVLGSIPALAPLLQKIAPNGQVIPPNGSGEKKTTVGA